MLAARLIRVARDILSEYAAFKIPELIADAANISAQRPNLNDQQYQLHASRLRAAANDVLLKSRFLHYPTELQNIVSRSSYGAALPIRVANVIVHGFPNDKNLAISSAELNMTLALVNSTSGQLNSLVQAAANFRIEEIVIPDGCLGIDVLVSRAAFGDRADKFDDLLAKFIDVMKYFIELATAQEGSPRLIYLSTSEPVTALALIAKAAYGFLKFYKLVLDVVEKHMSMRRAIKAVHESGIAGEEVAKFEERATEIVSKGIEAATREAIGSIKSELAAPRINEISIGIEKATPKIIVAIAEGSRVSLTLESIDRLQLICEAVPGLSAQGIKDELQEQRKIEDKVTEARRSLEGPIPLLNAPEKEPQ